MDKTQLIELFEECWNNSTIQEKISIHNEYDAENCRSENMIYGNDEMFFDETLSNMSRSEIVRAVFFGKYNYNDDWVWFNGYANLESGHYEDELPFDDIQYMAEYYIENYSILSFADSMEKFVNACEESDAD